MPIKLNLILKYYKLNENNSDLFKPLLLYFIMIFYAIK